MKSDLVQHLRSVNCRVEGACPLPLLCIGNQGPTQRRSRRLGCGNFFFYSPPFELHNLLEPSVGCEGSYGGAPRKGEQLGRFFLDTRSLCQNDPVLCGRDDRTANRSPLSASVPCQRKEGDQPPPNHTPAHRQR